MTSSLARRVPLRLILAASLLAAPVAGLSENAIDLGDLGGSLNGTLVQGPEEQALVGMAVSGAGDFNGDGVPDFVFGAPNMSPGGLGGAGSVFIVMGVSSSGVIDLASITASGGDAGVRVNGLAELVRLGVSVSGAGDVNGDGLDDVIIGAPFVTYSTGSPGEAYVLFGSETPGPVNLSDLGAPGNTDGFRIEGGDFLDEVGSSVSAAGDVNGDGLDDVVIGVPGADAGGLAGSGAGYVIFGKTDSNTVQLPDVASPTGDGGFIIEGVAQSDQIGNAVSGAGDVNGDGLADLLVGSIYAGSGGEAYVVFGKGDGGPVALSALGTPGNSDGFRILPASSGEAFAFRLSGVGDVNGDGLADALVSAANADAGVGFGTGRSYVFFGKADGDTVSAANLGLPGGPGGFAIDGWESGGAAGLTVSGTGDANGDGFADVLIGAPLVGSDNSGEAYLVFGKATNSPVALGNLGVPGNMDGILFTPRFPGDGLAGGLSGVGDVSGDLIPDFMIGAPGTNPQQRTRAGEVYIPFLDLQIPASATYIASAPPGDAPRIPIGVTGDRTNHRTPDSRLVIDFADGDNASVQTVTLTRNDAGLGGTLVLEKVADAQWRLESTRTNWTSARVTLRYAESEIPLLNESTLEVLAGDPATGVYTPLTDIVVDEARNEISGVITQLPTTLIIRDSTPVPAATSITKLDPDPRSDQGPLWSVSFNQPVISFDSGDITPTGDLAPFVTVIAVDGTDAEYIVSLVVDGNAPAGMLGFDIADDGYTDLLGFPGEAATAPAYNFLPPSFGFRGDVNDDDLIDASDVTALVDFILGR